MATKEKNKIQNRREFFKQAAKKTLPVLAIAPILQSCDTMLIVLEAMAEASTQYQNSQPTSTYSPSSSYNAPTGCSSCSSACNNSCSNSCRGDCAGECYTGCRGTCDKTCQGECGSACRVACVNTCRGYCKLGCHDLSY